MNTLRYHNHLTALVLTFAILLAVVGLGLSSVRAENEEVTVSELTVKKGPDGTWYSYLAEPGVSEQSLTADSFDDMVIYTGVAKNSKGWWRVEAGRVNFKANGVYKNDKGFWYIKNGKVDFTFAGFLSLNYTVDPVDGSPIYSDEKGIPLDQPKASEGTNATAITSKKAFWYLEGGKVQVGYTGAKKAFLKGEKAWWRVENGRANPSYNGVAKNEYGWWYFENGKVNFDYTGVAKNDKGWWRIENGKVNFGYNGIASNEYGSWYIVNGKVDFSYSGAIAIDDTMYVVENGKVTLKQKLSVDALPPIRPGVTFTYYGAELNWNAVKAPGNKSVDGYEVYVKNSPTARWSKVATVDGSVTSFSHNLGSRADPTQNTRLYDVRAIVKNKWGIIVATSPENKQTPENNYVGGAFTLAPPDIVSVKDNLTSRTVRFKTVPYATSYMVYYGKSSGTGLSWTKVTTVRAQNSGSGSVVDAKNGWQKGNQEVTIPKYAGFDRVTVKAVYTERAGNGYSALTLNSAYDTGFLLDQKQLSGKKVLFMGDSLICGTPYGPTTQDYTIPTRVAQQTGATVYNAAVGGATLVSDYPRIVNNSILHNQNIPLTEGYYSVLGEGDWKDITDMSDFDIVVLEGGPNDFFQNVQLGAPDSNELKYFYGALNKHMSLLKSASQKRVAAGKEPIQVVLVDLLYNPEGLKNNYRGLNYKDYSKALKALYEKYQDDADLDVYFYDTHQKVLNEKNYKTETVDNVHMTAFRYGQVGNDLAVFLKSLEPKEHPVEVTIIEEPTTETPTEPATEEIIQIEESVSPA